MRMKRKRSSSNNRWNVRNGATNTILMMMMMVMLKNKDRNGSDSSLWVDGQVTQDGCGNTCPPINFGQEVPALCVGNVMDETSIGSNSMNREYVICHPQDAMKDNNKFTWKELQSQNKIVVVANYYTGCNAGRRESGVYAHVAQRYYNEYPNDIVFVQSVKGGGSCSQWADIYQSDAEDLYPNSGIVPTNMPWSVNDDDYSIRDDLFTTPFGHPSYVILDKSTFELKAKFIGPCCGAINYFDCQSTTAKQLDTQLTSLLDPLLVSTTPPTSSPTKATPSPTNKNNDNNNDDPITTTPSPTTTSSPTTPAPTTKESTEDDDCSIVEWSEWSECSVRCGVSSGIQFRWRATSTTNTNDKKCPLLSPLETKSCSPTTQKCPGEDDSNSSNKKCIPEFGNTYTISIVQDGFDKPRDVAFHPTPGLHLGNYSEGRMFHPPQQGSTHTDHEEEEAWVVNAGNHSISIVTSIGHESHQTTLSRRDRGYYHYSVNVSAIAFNGVKNSGRAKDRDGFNYFAVCNDDANTYIGTKEPNFFMGPTLYDSKPTNRNIVNRLGQHCQPNEQPCYFLHSDMLHESPVCIGLAHDPENKTTYGNVYWAFDATGNGQYGQLVRFDFQQPHGPGSMDHSIAAIRRYVEVQLHRKTHTDNDHTGIHAGMMVHPTLRQLFISNPGSNQILMVDADSGDYARTARKEFPIFSNRLPSFEYSIWECVTQHVFATNIQTPSGLTISNDGKRLFVAERETGNILVYEIESGAFLHAIWTNYKSIGGMAMSSSKDTLYFVDEDTNRLLKVQSTSPCNTPFVSRVHPKFTEQFKQAQNQLGTEESMMSLLYKNYTCQVDPVIPNSTYFDQVHTDSGYASNNTDVQSTMAGMDASAALLANRTDCGFDSDLNFDALLLGGYYCHVCLPEQELTCDHGGQCTNVQWLGYTCDNEYYITLHHHNLTITITQPNNGHVPIKPKDVILKRDVTYQFTVFTNTNIGSNNNIFDANQHPLCIEYPSTSCSGRNLISTSSIEKICASNGPLIIPITSCFPLDKINLIVKGKGFGISLSILDTSGNEKTQTVNEPSSSSIAGIEYSSKWSIIIMIAFYFLCNFSF